ncbi:MAG: hypothetical protein KDJ80_06050 [Nitratireductor sp.]|nr:hypothetical protein [Nitratireductor sp.]
MPRLRAAAVLIAKLLVGCPLAVIVSALTVVVVKTAPTVLPDQGRCGILLANAKNPIHQTDPVSAGKAPGGMITAMTAWSGYLLTLLLALSGRSRPGHKGFAPAGLLTAIQAVLLHCLSQIADGFSAFLQMLSIFFEGQLWRAILPGGLAGSYACGRPHFRLFAQGNV